MCCLFSTVTSRGPCFPCRQCNAVSFYPRLSGPTGSLVLSGKQLQLAINWRFGQSHFRIKCFFAYWKETVWVRRIKMFAKSRFIVMVQQLGTTVAQFLPTWEQQTEPVFHFAIGHNVVLPEHLKITSCFEKFGFSAPNLDTFLQAIEKSCLYFQLIHLSTGHLNPVCIRHYPLCKATWIVPRNRGIIWFVFQMFNQCCGK